MGWGDPAIRKPGRSAGRHRSAARAGRRRGAPGPGPTRLQEQRLNRHNLAKLAFFVISTKYRLRPRRPSTNGRVTTAVRGRPNLHCEEELLRKIHRLSGTTRREVMALAQDRQRYHQFIERLCSIADQS